MQRASSIQQADLHITRSVAIDIDLEIVAARPNILQMCRSLVTAKQGRTVHILDVTAGDADARERKAIAAGIEVVNGIIGSALGGVRDAEEADIVLACADEDLIRPPRQAL
ncbi:hypothetical protein C7M62_16165 [Bradyrhizobium sp. WBAH10]|nr:MULTISPECIES: hypothetical protein [Bradyrhizobium]NRB88113.1 hypothetical protein [Bradyrhizobium sp. WBAH10]